MKQAFTTVRTTRTLMEADLLIAALQRAGLHPLEVNTFGHFSLAGAEIEYPVRVPTAEMAGAREIMESYDAENSA